MSMTSSVPSTARSLATVARAALVLVFGAGWGASAAQAQARSGLVAVIGSWADSATTTPSLTVDGTKWSGTTAADQLSRASERLFGTSSADFVRNGSAAGAFPLAVHVATPSFGNGTLRVQFNMRGGASDQNAGIVFGLTPAGEYLYARYNTKDGDLALWRFVNGERQLIVHGTGTSKLALGAWHELVVTISDRTISASIAGNSTVSLRHTLDSAPTGRVGVWVKRDAVTSFRNFQVTP
ncbi:MAG: hypothetical protein IT353_04985 [Gemmatimonadaceae bacterium]|nr:hypothetical protein [Gemmatimonadaceae bacterium]